MMILARAPVFGAAAAVLLVLAQHTCAEHAVEHSAPAFARPHRMALPSSLLLPARGRDRRGCGMRLASEPDFQELRKNALRPGEALLLRVSMLAGTHGGHDADPPAAAACESMCVCGGGGGGSLAMVWFPSLCLSVSLCLSALSLPWCERPEAERA